MGLKDLTPHLPPPRHGVAAAGLPEATVPPGSPPNQASSSHPALGVWSPHPIPDALGGCCLSRLLTCYGGCRGGPQGCVHLEPVNVPFEHIGSLQV